MTTNTLDDRIGTLRAAKAERIAAGLRAERLTAADAARLTMQARRAVEQACGVRIGSRATWTIAVDLLAQSARRTCPFCGQGDPDGVYGPPQVYGHVGPCSR